MRDIIKIFKDVLPSFVMPNSLNETIGFKHIPEYHEASDVLNEAGVIGSNLSFSQHYSNIYQLILQYRQFAQIDFVDDAIDEIVNEAIVIDSENPVVKIDLEMVELSDSIKKKIIEEFEYIKSLLNFDNKADEMFRDWYIDGRKYQQYIYNKNPKKGLIQILDLIPFKIVRIWDEKTSKYWYYLEPNEEDVLKKVRLDKKHLLNKKTYLVSEDYINFVPSGLKNPKQEYYLSHLHRAIKPANQLMLLEDSMVVYRFCLVGNTRIRVENSYKYIKDIKQGDKIHCYSADGSTKLSNVTNWVINGKKEVFKVSSKHVEITATATHPILVKRGDNLQYVDIKDLKLKSDKLINSVNVANKKTKISILFGKKWARLNENGKKQFRANNYANINELLRETKDFGTSKQSVYANSNKALPINEALKICDIFDIDIENLIIVNKGQYNEDRINLPEYVDEEFARLFGFMCGDGHLHRGYQLSICTGIHEEINNRYKKILEKYFGVVSFEQDKRLDSGLGKLIVNSKVACQVFTKLGYINNHYETRIPEWVFESSASIRKSFVEGLSDADGCIRHTNKGLWFSNIELSNLQLVEDIKEIWASIGLCSGHIKKRVRPAREFEGRMLPETTSYSIYISEQELPLYENILSVESQGCEYVYDISVEDKLHNFIANGIPVHNTRAPERRAFYIDVGRMGKNKADEYIKKLMNKFKTRLSYDTSTGSINQKKSVMTMLEDYWLPRMGNKGTEVQSLSGGQQLGEITDIQYMKRRVWKALRVPASRADQENPSMISFGDDSINREELKFNKKCSVMRQKFSNVLLEPLRVHCIAKKILNQEEWSKLLPKIQLRWNKDSYWAEMKDSSIFNNRLDTLDRMEEHKGKYFSNEWIKKNILKQDDKEIEEMKKQMDKEFEENPPEDEDE